LISSNRTQAPARLDIPDKILRAFFKQIADALDLSSQTVHKYRSRFAADRSPNQPMSIRGAAAPMAQRMSE
jgi:FixJ family two-component response regulator